MSDNKRDFVDQDLPAEIEVQLKQGKPIWNTEDLQRDFSVLGFLAPFVVVKKKETGQKGSLEFTHRPRFYFNWLPEERS